MDSSIHAAAGALDQRRNVDSGIDDGGKPERP